MPVYVHDRYLGIKKALKLLNFKALLSFMIHRTTSSISDLHYLSEPENRLLFAEEATSIDRFGYVDGAFVSGIREATRLIGQDTVKISILSHSNMFRDIVFFKIHQC